MSTPCLQTLLHGDPADKKLHSLVNSDQGLLYGLRKGEMFKHLNHKLMWPVNPASLHQLDRRKESKSLSAPSVYSLMMFAVFYCCWITWWAACLCQCWSRSKTPIKYVHPSIQYQHCRHCLSSPTETLLSCSCRKQPADFRKRCHLQCLKQHSVLALRPSVCSFACVYIHKQALLLPVGQEVSVAQDRQWSGVQ